MRNRLVLAAGMLSILTLILISGQTKSSEQERETTWGQDSIAVAGTVKVTPLGSHAGELCRNDRAMLFEDPSGVAVLWDPGRTVDENDPRLGKVNLILLSSTHGDHIGDAKPNPSGAGSCAAPSTVSAAPNSTSAAIAAAKSAAVLAGGEMGEFLARKIQNIRGGVATPSCPASGPDNEMVVPMTVPCVGALRPGGRRAVRLANAAAGVTVANVPAFHSNGIPASLVDAPGIAPGLTAYGGNDGGAIVRFSNGLVVYLTADTGIDANMETIIKRFYGAELMVVNMGDVFSMGPEEASYAVNRLVQPRTVIPTHINEAATAGGLPVGDRLQRFLKMVDRRRTAVEIPLSGITMEFDGRGRRVNK